MPVNTRPVWAGPRVESTIPSVMVAPRFEGMAWIKNIVSLMAFAGQIVSCSTAPSTQTPIRDPQTLIQALRTAGASLENAKSDPIIVGLPDPQFFLLDGELVQIGPSALEPSELQELGATNLNTRIWHGPGWYLAYAGRDGGVILFLSGLLGEPFQETPLALAEPFPPAVPRAMRKLADALNSSPSELTVLDFESMTWPDACLGIESTLDDCTPGAVTGWTVSLMLNDVRYEVHSDDAGEIVRWTDPTEGTEE